MAYDPVHGQVVLFGGSAGTLYYGDTWIWNGANWTLMSPQTSPPARFGHTMAYDAARGQVVLFGGNGSNNTLLNDTWAWDGADWSQKSTPFSAPPVRYRSAMVYDSAHKVIVLFGGLQSKFNSTLNDTWIWDGSSWSQRSPATSPEPLESMAMAYDSSHGQVVMFGGAIGLSLSVVNDTWVWDGANWSKKSPQTSPGGRQLAGMAYDSIRGQTILFGGVGIGLLADTWIWDGANWTRQSPAKSPIQRADFSMAYDSGHDQIVLGGGSGGSGGFDTWTWNGGSAGPVPTINAVITASAYGGSTTVGPGSWVEIYGSNLASTTRSWSGADFKGNNAPTTLDGVQVTIGGQNAFVDYVSTTGQINAQLPSNIPTGGNLPVVVTNGSTSSAAFMVAVKSASPALLAPAAFQIGGKQYLAALFSDNATFALPPNAIAGVPSRQAHPGETIVTYGVGFGSVVPDTPAGMIATAQNMLAAQFQVSIGSTLAQVQYAGLTPGFVGLYQFNIVVPAVPDNDLTPVTFSLGGAAGTQTLYIAVHQ